MDGTVITYYKNYTPVGDLVVLATCFVIIVLIHVAYISKTRNFRLFQGMVALLMIASFSGVGYHTLLNMLDIAPAWTVYLLHSVYHLALFSNLFLYICYIVESLHLDHNIWPRYVLIGSIALFLMVLYEILGPILKIGFYIQEDQTIHDGFHIFPFGYLFFIGVVVFLLITYRNRIAKPIFQGILGTCIISFMILAIQGRHHQVSFTTATFLFPTFTLLYLIHANPYDIESGAVGAPAFHDTISYNYNRKRKLVLMSLLMHDFEGTGKKYPEQFQSVIRHFCGKNSLYGTVLFQISGGRMILSIDTKRNPSYQKAIKDMLQDFSHEYEKFKLDYKIVITKTYDEISTQNDYVGLIQYVESKMLENDVHVVEDKDIEAYHKYKYILSELADIHKKKDLDDPRVLVFCQPVFNIMTGKYDTAEALMRLKLEETGMVFPDQFIPLAEDNHYIHTLSQIILHKTCMHIKSLLQENYEVMRISVNFSVMELHDKNFCQDIDQIIQDSGIPYDKIAIEITESQNENDFLIMKDKINELRTHGIKFYLDDFGTGYSNFERIMELLFDIIKFDRSLVIACGNDKKSEMMVSHLAKMFDAMNYAVLYEGVEDDKDEEKCKQMFAKYLQGYKYSRPIPMEKLTEYFEQAA